MSENFSVGASVFLLMSVLLTSVAAHHVSAGVIECNTRIEVDAVGIYPSVFYQKIKNQAQLGKDGDGSAATDRRVWAEFDIS